MTTFGTMQDRIADELDRTDLTTQIQREIKSAITYYDKHRFWFNEARNISFATVDGTEYYGSTNDSDIPNLLFIDTLKIALNASDKYDLERVPFQEIDSDSQGITLDEGKPVKYAYYAKQIRLYPIPDASYSIYGAGVIALGDLSVTGDTNAWMTDGEALIRSRAKWALFTHVIKDVESARTMKQAELDELSHMVAGTNSRSGTGRLVATAF
jgi:hypothetical protein